MFCECGVVVFVVSVVVGGVGVGVAVGGVGGDLCRISTVLFHYFIIFLYSTRHMRGNCETMVFIESYRPR